MMYLCKSYFPTSSLSVDCRLLKSYLFLSSLFLLFCSVQLSLCSPLGDFHPKLFTTHFSMIHFESPKDKLQLIRKQQLCLELPTSELGNYFFDQKTQLCYLRGTHGPCNENMIFGSLTDEASLYDSLETIQNGQCHCEERNGRVHIFHTPTNQCFPIFSQGPCASNEWLTLKPVSNIYHCALNPCLEHLEFEMSENRNQSNETIVYFNNRCVRLGHSVPECEENERIQFVSGEIFPTCVSTIEEQNDASDFSAGALSKPKCRSGASRSPNGKCVKNFFW